MNNDHNHIIKELHRDNLCTYFILPLLKLNKFRFLADSNFVDSFISYDRKSIIVQVLETLFLEYKLMEHPFFKAVYQDDMGNRFIEYSIPERFQQDLEHFCNGQFSSFSEKAKQLIYTYSGLANRVKLNSYLFTDIRLLALEKSTAVKEMWEDSLACTLGDNQELLSIPESRIYMNTDALQRVELEMYV